MAKDAQGHGSAGRGGVVVGAQAPLSGAQHVRDIAAMHGVATDHLGPSTGDMHQDIANAVAYGLSKSK